MSESQRALLQAWAGGDKQAGEQLFSELFPVLVRFFRNKVPAQDMEELVQKTTMALVEKGDRFRGESKVKTFAVGMARIELLRYLRFKHRRDERETDFENVSVVDLDPSPSQIAAKQAEQQLVLVALRRIPVELQIVLELHYWEEMTTNEIAEAIDAPQGTAKSRLRRAREQLEAAIAELAESPADESKTVSRLEDWAAKLRAQILA